MKKIPHDLTRDPPIRLNEFVAEIEKKDASAVRDVAQRLVHLECFAALKVEILAERKNAEEEDFGFG
jgi:hypothetical protein